MNGDDKLKGLGGWLALVGIGVVTSPIRSLIMLIDSYKPIFEAGMWKTLTTEGSDAYIPYFSSIIVGEIVFNTMLLIASIYLIYLFFSKTYLFPKFYIGIVATSLIFIPLDAWVVAIMFPDEPMFDPDTTKQFMGTLMAGVVWVPYMLFSKRVKVTFVENRKIRIISATNILIICVICAAVVFLFLGVDPEVTEQKLQAEASSYTESNGGEMIDDITRFDSADASGLTVKYHYTITTLTANDININDFAAGRYPSLAASACDLVPNWLAAGVDMQHQYAGSDGLPITSIKITRSACSDLTDEKADSGAQLSPREIAASANSAFVSIAGYVNGEEVSSGSGFLVRHDGVLVTNLHVLQGAERLKVTLPSGEIYDTAYVLNVDERRDLAILQIQAVGLSVLPIGDDRVMEVGDTVYVLGNPLGYDQTFSDGILSAKRLEDGVQYLQISAPISPGSSGGPVLNEQGHVIAVATSLQPDGQNLNIAMPSHYISGMLAVITVPEPFETVAGSGPFADTDPVRIRNAESSELLELAPASLRDEIAQLESSGQQVMIRLLSYGAAIEIEDEIMTKTSTDTEFGALDNGDSDFFELDLQGGEYMAFAVCDDDCTDVDMGIEINDEEPLIDRELDAFPVIYFELKSPTSVRLQIEMQDCAQEPCAFGWQLNRK